jgi:hypothetical protein
MRKDQKTAHHYARKLMMQMLHGMVRALIYLHMWTICLFTNQSCVLQECTFTSVHTQIACWSISKRVKMARDMASTAWEDPLLDWWFSCWSLWKTRERRLRGRLCTLETGCR